MVFALQPSLRQLGTGTQLWVCPLAPFEDLSRTSADCDVYDPSKGRLLLDRLGEQRPYFLGNLVVQSRLLRRLHNRPPFRMAMDRESDIHQQDVYPALASSIAITAMELSSIQCERSMKSLWT